MNYYTSWLRDAIRIQSLHAKWMTWWMLIYANAVQIETLETGVMLSMLSDSLWFDLTNGYCSTQFLRAARNLNYIQMWPKILYLSAEWVRRIVVHTHQHFLGLGFRKSIEQSTSVCEHRFASESQIREAMQFDLNYASNECKFLFSFHGIAPVRFSFFYLHSFGTE